jgi:hypothetical protein
MSSGRRPRLQDGIGAVRNVPKRLERHEPALRIQVGELDHAGHLELDSEGLEIGVLMSGHQHGVRHPAGGLHEANELDLAGGRAGERLAGFEFFGGQRAFRMPDLDHLACR